MKMLLLNFSALRDELVVAAILNRLNPLQTLLLALGTELNRILAVLGVAYGEAVELDLAFLGVLGIGHDSMTVTALEQNQAQGLGAVDVLVVEQEVLVQSKPFYLPLGRRVR